MEEEGEVQAVAYSVEETSTGRAGGRMTTTGTRKAARMRATFSNGVACTWTPSLSQFTELRKPEPAFTSHIALLCLFPQLSSRPSRPRSPTTTLARGATAAEAACASAAPGL